MTMGVDFMRILKNAISGRRIVNGLVLACLVTAVTARAEVRIRVHFKFILNQFGNRPGVGDIISDADVEAQVERANHILGINFSEFRVHSLGITDVAGIDQYYLTRMDNDPETWALRTNAVAHQAAYGWRTDAINIYINGGNGSAVSYYPPNNDYILVNQNIFDTTVAHEMGHSLSLRHTHDESAMPCGDTIEDESSWNQDDIATNAFGVFYNACSQAQKDQVNLVYSNLMSYHDGDNRSLLSPCQMDYESGMAWDDRAWMLTDSPVYVDGSYGGASNGSFDQPYETVQEAINGGLNGKVLVIEGDVYNQPASVMDTSTRVVPRSSTVYVREMPPPYERPIALEYSTNAALASAITEAQAAAKQGDDKAYVAALRKAEAVANGREKVSVQLGLADHFNDRGDFKKAEFYYRTVRSHTQQKGLIDRMDSRLKKVARRIRDAEEKTANGEEPEQ